MERSDFTLEQSDWERSDRTPKQVLPTCGPLISIVHLRHQIKIILRVSTKQGSVPLSFLIDLTNTGLARTVGIHIGDASNIFITI